jgi:tetratricopeptide (TPR) repeat protein
VGHDSHGAKSQRLTRALSLVLALHVLVGAAGCKTFSDNTRATRTALDANDFEKALAASNRALGVKKPETLPESLKDNDALLLLDRAIVLQALQQYELSSRDFQVADKELEVLDFSRSTAHEIARYMFSDSVGPYRARPYEKLMLNTMNMINYLARQNLEGAKVEARRFSIMRKYLLDDEEADAEAVKRAGAPGSYFAGFAFEKAASPGEALRYYDEVLQATSAPSLGDPIRSLMQQSGYRTSRLQSAAGSAEGSLASPDQSSEVLIVIGYGRVPALVAKRVPIGLALTVAAAFLSASAVQQANRLAAQGLVTWVNYPELVPTRAEYPAPLVAIDGTAQSTHVIANVDDVVQQAWAESKGRVMAAAVTRMLTRAAVGAGVGVAAGKASGRGGVGVLASMIAQASMAAADKPDTRSWATLPARIAIVRTRLPPGKHSIEVTVLGRRHVLETTVGAGQWVFMDISQLSTL